MSTSLKIIASCLIFFSLVLTSGCNEKQAEKTGLEGQVIPKFTLLLSDSTTFSNTMSATVEKPMVVFYYNPHCPYCRSQMDEIIDDMDKLKDIQFYLVTSSSLSELKEFNSKYNLRKYPNIVNGIDLKNHLADYYEVEGVPFTAIYGKNNKLNQVYIGKVYSRLIKKASLY